MTLSNIFLKSLRERRLSLFWWIVSIFMLVIMINSVYPSIQKSAVDFKSYIDNMPKAIKAAFSISGAGAITSPAGFLNAELFTLMIPIMFLIFAIGFGADAIAGEEEAGTLDLLLANPIPRRRVVLEKFLAMTVGMGLLSFILWLSLVFGAKMFDLKIGLGQLAAAAGNSGLLGLCFGTVALAAGSGTGKKSLSIAAGVAFAAASYLLNILTKIVDSLQDYEKLSLFYYHLNADPLTNGLRYSNIAILIGFIMALLAIAIVLFQRRDLSV